MDTLGNKYALYIYFQSYKNLVKNTKIFKSHVIKLLKYKNYRRCVYGSTYIKVNMICTTRRNPQKFYPSFFLN